MVVQKVVLKGMLLAVKTAVLMGSLLVVLTAVQWVAQMENLMVGVLVVQTAALMGILWAD